MTDKKSNEELFRRLDIPKIDRGGLEDSGLLGPPRFGSRLVKALIDLADEKSPDALSILSLIKLGHDPEEVVLSALPALIKSKMILQAKYIQLFQKYSPVCFIEGREEIERLKSANSHKAELLDRASALIGALVDEDFEASNFSNDYRNKYLDFLSETWSD